MNLNSSTAPSNQHTSGYLVYLVPDIKVHQGDNCRKEGSCKPDPIPYTSQPLELEDKMPNRLTSPSLRPSPSP